MTDPQPADWRIFCIIVDENIPFSVKLQSDKTVDELKEAIQLRRANLADIDATHLTLYRIDPPDNNNLNQAVEQLLNSDSPPKPLMPTSELSDIFQGTPAKRTVHILVQPPNDATTPPNPSVRLPDPLTPTRRDKLNKDIAEFKVKLRSTFEAFLRDDVQLPVWQPPFGDEEVRDHIAGLKIPAVSSVSQSPSLLLHNLGQPSHDPKLAERVDKLFRPGGQQRFLCNTSGSGKTRLLLEGLWRNWGFYFTARTQPDRIGSSDLENILYDLEEFEHLTILTDENRDTALNTNQRVARHRSRLILYVRMSVFRVFLECASAMPGGITENHKGRWLLIQVAPVTLLGAPDIFDAFTQVIGKLDSQSLKGNILSELIAIERLITPSLALFCVLDEAQVPTNMFSNCFLSETEPARPRPILREIILTWTSSLPNLIVSGTGVSMQEVGTFLSSAVAKPSGVRPETVTDLGAFDSEEDQRTYLEYYLPPGFLDTASGKAVASRVGYWLCGRHRFTATYISRLLATGITSPHQVLNDFVNTMTGFQPSDLDDYSSLEASLLVKLTETHYLGFSSLLKRSEEEPWLLITVASFVFEYTFTGKIRGLGGPNGDKMVELGVSRFKKPGVAETDEPLAILGLVTFLRKQNMSLESYLRQALNDANASTRGFAFEPFGAYLLAHTFSSPRPLSDVFEFIGENKLKDEVVELVTLERNDDTFQMTPFNLESHLRSKHVVGCSPSTPAGTLEWLQNPGGSAFCFPTNVVGPNLICVLRLTSDGTVLRVCVQFKNTKGLGPKDTENAIRTTDPFAFLSQAKAGQLTTSSSRMQAEMIEAIKNLGGKGTKKAGVCGVLRVLVYHPSPPDDDTLEEAAKNSHHPLARLRVDRLEAPDSDLGQAILELANKALNQPDRKRRNLDESDGTKTKKQKTGTEVRGEVNPCKEFFVFLMSEGKEILGGL